MVYDPDSRDGRTLAAVGVCRVALDPHHDSLEHLRDEGRIEPVDLGVAGRGLT